MSTVKRKLPVRCVAHVRCRGDVAAGIACARREVECREFVRADKDARVILVLVREPARGIMEGDWHRPCDACLGEGAVKDGNEFGKGFMTCCTRQWKGGTWRCSKCDERGIEVEHARLAFDEKTRRQVRQHLRQTGKGPGASASKFAGFWCGPLVSDDECPGYWERFGAACGGGGTK